HVVERSEVQCLARAHVAMCRPCDEVRRLLVIREQHHFITSWILYAIVVLQMLDHIHPVDLPDTVICLRNRRCDRSGPIDGKRTWMEVMIDPVHVCGHS